MSWTQTQNLEFKTWTFYQMMSIKTTALEDVYNHAALDIECDLRSVNFKFISRFLHIDFVNLYVEPPSYIYGSIYTFTKSICRNYGIRFLLVDWKIHIVTSLTNYFITCNQPSFQGRLKIVGNVWRCHSIFLHTDTLYVWDDCNNFLIKCNTKVNIYRLYKAI
jgi:hypothetical protein